MRHISCDSCGANCDTLVVRLNADLVPVRNEGPVAVEYDSNSESGLDICPGCMSKPLQLLKLFSKGFRNKLEAIAPEAVNARIQANLAAHETLLVGPLWRKEPADAADGSVVRTDNP